MVTGWRTNPNLEGRQRSLIELVTQTSSEPLVGYDIDTMRLMRSVTTSSQQHADTEKRKFRERFKKAGADLLVLTTAIVVIFLVTECAVRVFAPQQLILLDPGIWRPDDTLGWRHRENVNTVVNSGEGSITFATDDMGHRVSQVSAAQAKDTGEMALLVLGDSFLEALSVPAEETIPELIREELHRRNPRYVKVVNTGVGGWDPNQYLLELRQMLRRECFEMAVVFLYVGNDIVMETRLPYPPRKPVERHHFRLPTKLRFEEWIDATLYPVNDFLETRSHVFIFIKNRFTFLLARLGLTARHFPDVFLLSEHESPRWQSATLICRKIQQECEQYSTACIFVLIPTEYQVDQDIFNEYLSAFRINPQEVDIEQPNRLLAQCFKQFKMTLLDPLLYLRQKANKGEVLYGQIDFHLNANGHHAITEYLLPTIEAGLKRESEVERSRDRRSQSVFQEVNSAGGVSGNRDVASGQSSFHTWRRINSPGRLYRTRADETFG
jgi:hypothetical protein